MTGNGEPSKVGGKVDAAVGAVKENVGKAFGAHQMEGEGAAKRAHGNAEHGAAQAKGYTEGAGDSLMGGVKKQAGKLFGDDQMQGEGKARELKGDVKKSANS
ncbi:hypothetical protein WJX81_004600 [Elliptochloris bilobata]|uniref:CsbD-like domain-containing protein n=1 Tax=Elliptochloris bilobata TaxID=381761 RepID=A0AAW1R2K6_9CHLO